MTVRIDKRSYVKRCVQAPAAFGLVSFLISDGIDRKRIRRHLLIFSLAAPLMALFTFVLLKSVRFHSIEHEYTVDNHVRFVRVFFNFTLENSRHIFR
jgi:hypothetical protein